MKTTDKLYIDLNNKEKPRTIYNFLKLFFIDGRSIPCTYHDINLSSIQCTSGRQRSINDIYNLCKTYYTSLTLKRFFEIFKKFIQETTVKGRYCGNTEAVVFSSKKGSYFYIVDENYYFMYRLVNSNSEYKPYQLSHNNYNDMEKYGFKHPKFSFNNLITLMK